MAKLGEILSKKHRKSVLTNYLNLMQLKHYMKTEKRNKL